MEPRAQQGEHGEADVRACQLWQRRKLNRSFKTHSRAAGLACDKSGGRRSQVSLRPVAAAACAALQSERTLSLRPFH